jgi:hypothetical protein
VTIAVVVSVAATVVRARTPPLYTVVAVLRATEGRLHTGEPTPEGALRAQITELTFTRARLVEVMKRHPRQFPDVLTDPDGAVEEMQELMTLEVAESDVIAEEADEDPPRSARISVGFSWSTPKGAWDIAQELSTLVVDTALERQRAASQHEQAGAESAVERAEEHADDTDLAGIAGVHQRLQEADQSAASATLAAHAAEQGQGLRFEVVDPGQIPAIASRRGLLIDFLAMFAVALVAACLLVGAFDPRIIGVGDLHALQIPLLGTLPRLPVAPPSSSQGPAAQA